MAEMALERGLLIHSSCIWRWFQIYGRELDQRCRAHRKRTNKSYRVDETYIRIKGQDRYLYRAVDSAGQTIDFLLTDNVMLRRPSDSFVRHCSTQPIRSLG
jgi:transposase-like protein